MKKEKKMEIVKSKNTSTPRTTKPVVKKAIKVVAPTMGRIQFNHVIITTNQVGQDSNIIMSSGNDKTNKAMMSEIQTVMTAGPNAGAYITPSGEQKSIQAGDIVLVDVGLLNAKRAQGGQTRLIGFEYTKSTGELITSLNEKDFDKDDSVNYAMISDREILMINP